ncbi:hypothetical protein SPRG_06165 [Saprolegnia parasitica CBS 223.65]|uniref:LNR domain-containing protein n=1 Tax=Saprolegnia parasitica (strain CBS 223.65) TaxID=695850 RepID=A0A067CED6_SAPPC|nr:hypothetical protein SPRG_06165 [Saprolegnia parasitica CBS 223.65]KDO29109.1 hypothetical protein SPRG_06165 [Saprolegnia parasitica CBS 223.65]|eukprot:XP_012200275.1 hypothetical protein SPRG_06165 [Saprolegnia parasitica CBS 223.65]
MLKRRLRVSAPDVIAWVCVLYAATTAYLHVRLARMPAVVTFLSLLNPLGSGVVFAFCSALHARVACHFITSRYRINTTTSQLRAIKPLVVRGCRPRAVKAAPRLTRALRLKSFFRLRLRSNEIATDLRVVRSALRHPSFSTVSSMPLQKLVLTWKDRWVRLQIAGEGHYARFMGPKGFFSRAGSHYELVRGVNWSGRIRNNFVVLYGFIFALQCALMPALIAWNFYKYADSRHRSKRRKHREWILVLVMAFDMALSVGIPIAIIVPAYWRYYINPAILSDVTFDVYAVSIIKSFMVASLLDLMALAVPLVMIAVTLRNLHEARVTAFLWDSIVTAASPVDQLAHLKKYFNLADLEGRLPSKALRNGAILSPGGRQQSRDLASLFASLPSLKKLRGTPVVPFHQALSPTTQHLTRIQDEEVRDHSSRLVLFGAALLVGSTAAVLVLIVVLRAASATLCLPPRLTDHWSCAGSLRPWHLSSLWDQACVCQIVHINCDSDAQVYENVATFVTTYPTEHINYLKLQGCDVGRLYPSMVRLSDLWGLEASAVPTQHPPDVELSQFSKLVYLSLRQNPWPDLPLFLQQVPPLLSALDLSETSFRTWPTWVGAAWFNLTQLTVVSARMMEFPTTLFELDWLATLDLTNNSIAVLPPVPGGAWSRVKDLRLGGNQLRAIPPNIFALPSLQTLTLAKNELTSCPVAPMPLGIYTLDDNPCCNASTTVPACASSCRPLCDSYYAASPVCSPFCNGSISCRSSSSCSV